MDKKPSISLTGLITIVISVSSLAVAVLAYTSSRNSNRSIVSVQPYPVPQATAPAPEAPFIHVLGCQEPGTSAFLAKYKVSKDFVVTNNGGLNASLISVHLSDELHSGGSSAGVYVVPRIYGYAKGEQLKLPIVFAGGTGAILTLRYDNQFRFATKPKLAASWVWQKERDVHWEFEFSNGSSITLPAGAGAIDITNQTGRTCSP